MNFDIQIITPIPQWVVISLSRNNGLRLAGQDINGQKTVHCRTMIRSPETQ